MVDRWFAGGPGTDALNRNEAPRKAPRSICSVPVWPSGDWLPSCRVERATQIDGGFGLASQQFPGAGMPKHNPGGVQELALETEPATA